MARLNRSRRPMYWILDAEHNLVPTDDVLVWGTFFEDMGKRRVAQDIIEQPESDPVRVSTVFLGLDHNWLDNGPPILFESMVFGGPLDGEMYRYPTWDSAAEGHKLLVDETVLEGKVKAWEVREQITAMSVRAWEASKQAAALIARQRKPKVTRTRAHELADTYAAVAKRTRGKKEGKA